jgi:hypothetical protein
MSLSSAITGLSSLARDIVTCQVSETAYYPALTLFLETKQLYTLLYFNINIQALLLLLLICLYYSVECLRNIHIL